MDIISANQVVFQSMIRYPDIKIAKEETTFIHGPSGCGKSTLLKLINGTISPDSGEILYNDNNIENIDTIKLRREILLVSQSVYLSRHYRRNFINITNTGITTFQKKIWRNSSAMQRRFSLETRCETMFRRTQRVYIAIFLRSCPKLMLDEPTSALTTSLRMNMKNIASMITR